jgi:serine/threonine-protein kinase HipA
MGRRKSYKPLNVFLNGRLVGQLLRESSGAISFTYAQEWLAWENTLPLSLSLPLREDRYVGAPVIAVFENLLPDSEPIRRRVAERVGAQGTDAFSLLSEIGRDCVGAMQFLGDDEEPPAAGILTGEPLSDEQIGAILKDLDVTPLGIRRENDFRISVAGAQDKTALLYHEGRWIAPSGTTPTTHILKPQIGKLAYGGDMSESVENEYLCLKLMEGFGLRAAQTEMKIFGVQKALVIERFDRLWTRDGRLIRLPQEDCCQALSVPPTLKYQSDGGPGIVDIMKLLGSSDDPTKDRLDFFKATILFWLLGATDGHAKNFSLGLLPGGRFRLSPLYDVLTTQPQLDLRQLDQKDFRLAMRVGKSRHYKVNEVQGRHFVETGVQAGLSREAIQNVFDEIHGQATGAIEKTYAGLPADFPEGLTASIATAIQTRLKRLVVIDAD